jgi:hypothetical protein
VARELERSVVALVSEILGAEFGEMPLWLVRPDKVECGDRWPLIEAIYSDLTDGMTLPEEMRLVERREVDAVLQRPGEVPRILEVDEKQHFNPYRARTLDFYADEVPLGYPPGVWLARSKQKTRLEGGGFGKPKPPLFPGDGGRHRHVRSATLSATSSRPSTASYRHFGSPASKSSSGSTALTHATG